MKRDFQLPLHSEVTSVAWIVVVVVVAGPTQNDFPGLSLNGALPLTAVSRSPAESISPVLGFIVM